MKKVKFKTTKEGEPTVKSKGDILAIILKEGKGSRWKWVDDDEERFSVDGNTYFIVDEGTYLKGSLRIMIFLEGISTPMNHSNIDREEVVKQVIDRDTQEIKKIKIQKIKGLKFDSKIIDVLLNRHLADEFTREHMDLPNLLIIIFLIIIAVLDVIGLGMWFI